MSDHGAAGRHCNPGAAHVGENVGESNKSIPGYRWYPLENAGKLIPKYNGAPLSRSLFFLRPSRDRILSTLPLPTRVPRERARNRRTTLELGLDSRGEIPRADLTITPYTTYLYPSPSISTHGDPARAGRDAATVRHTAISGGDLAGFPPCSSAPSPLPSWRKTG